VGAAAVAAVVVVLLATADQRSKFTVTLQSIVFFD